MFNKSDIQRFVISSVGAVALSATCIIGAVGPAKAATVPAPLTVQDWQRTVEYRIETLHEDRKVYQPQQMTASNVTVRFTADGDFAGAVVARPSGDRELDTRALKVARAIAYPALPAGFRGTPALVHMTLYFGNSAEAMSDYAALKARAANTIRIARADDDAGIQVAAR